MSHETSHPQHAVHAISLLSSPASADTMVHPAFTSAPVGITPVGNADAQAFWLGAAKLISWEKEPDIAFGQVPGEIRPTWFPKAKLNTTYNCVDRHVKDGYGDRVCFHHYSPLPAAKARPTRSMTYREVMDETMALAGVLKEMGVKKLDRVIIYMPMVLEGAIAMLACARIGAIHSVVFGGFAPKELAKRIDDAKPTAIIAASCGLEATKIIDYKMLVEGALAVASQSAPVLYFRRENIVGHQIPSLKLEKGDRDWKTEMERVRREGKLVEKCEPMDSSDPLYILYTSGTTGTPKGVVRFNGGHAVASRYAIEHTFGLRREDSILTASDFGWVVGHSFSLYSPLLLGATSIIFEGKPILPDAGVFWKMVETYKAAVVYTAPTALRAIRRDDPTGKLMRSYNLKSLRGLFLAGERSEPGIVVAYQKLLTELAAPGALVNDNYWSTESGSPITAIQMNSTFPPLTLRPGSAGLPLPGMDVKIVDEDGKLMKKGEMGNIVLGQPLPPTALGTVWGNEGRYQEAYFDRFRGKGDWFDTGDAGVIDDAGYVSILSRADDLINVAGHRLGTSLLEQVVSSHPLIAECCVVGLPDSLKGHVPFALVIRGASPEAQSADPTSLLTFVNKHVREDIGGIATLGGLVCTPRLPKTRSGKTLRRTIKELVENAAEGKWDKAASFPPTIEDASVVEECRVEINRSFTDKAKAGKAKL